MRVVSESPSELVLEELAPLRVGGWWDVFAWVVAVMMIAGAVVFAKRWWLERDVPDLLWAISSSIAGLSLVLALLFPARERWRFDGRRKRTTYTFAPFPGVWVKRRSHGLPTAIEPASRDLKLTFAGDVWSPRRIGGFADGDEAARVARLIAELTA